MGIHVTLLFDPAIEVDYDVFARGKQQGAQWIMWPPGTTIPHVDLLNDHYPMTKGTMIMLSVVWPDNNVAFPDFLDETNATNKWWASEFGLFHQTVQIMKCSVRYYEVSLCADAIRRHLD
jgi:hypothetical protein